MKLIEEGKQFDDQLSIEELDQVIGGDFCFILRTCKEPSAKTEKKWSCGIFWNSGD